MAPERNDRLLSLAIGEMDEMDEMDEMGEMGEMDEMGAPTLAVNAAVAALRHHT